MDEDIGAVAFLSGSQARVALLEQLRRNGRLTERELRGRVEGARTTVHRNLDKLCERGWVRQSGGQYSITTAGEFVVDEFLELVDTVETASRLQPFLECVPGEALDLELRWLRDAELTTPEPGNPLATVNRHVERIEEASRLNALLPVAGLHPYEIVHERVCRGVMEVECIASPSVAETVLSDPDFADLTAEMLDTGQFELYTCDERIPYYLGILDDRVEIGVDDDGSPAGILGTTSENVYEWAETKYAEYRSAADPVT